MANDNKSTNGGNNSNSGNNSSNNGGRRNRGGRRGGKRSGNSGTSNNSRIKAKPVMKELKDIVFDAERYNQADEFIKMKKDLAQYIATNYERGADVQQSIEAGKMIELPEPTAPTPTDGQPVTETKTLIWKRQIEMYVKRQEKLEDNLRQAFGLVIGQCTEVMLNKLEALSEFKAIKEKCDVLALLEQMKSLTFKYEEQKYCYSSVYYANKRFYNFKQGQDDNCTEYYNKFNNLVSVVESYGGTFGYEDILMENDEEYQQLSVLERADRQNIEAAQARSKEKFLTYSLIAKADQKRFGALKTELENDFNKGNNNYPTTTNKALRMLVNYKGDRPNNRNNNNSDGNNVSFAQNSRGGNNGGNNRGNNNNNSNRFDNSWHKDATCHNCGKKGHIKPNCPDAVETVNNNNGEESDNSPNSNTSPNGGNNDNNNGNTSNQGGGKKKKGSNHASINKNMFLTVVDEYDTDTDDELNCNFLMNQKVQLLTQNQKQEMKKIVLLDSASTCDLWNDRASLVDIRPIKSKMTVETNGGELITKEKGFCPGYGAVWVHDDAITNIVSLKNIKKKFKVTFNSELDAGFMVHTPNGVLIFKEHPSGLYYCSLEEFHDAMSPNAVQLIQTVEDNKSRYTQRQYDRALAAYEAYTKIGCPSINDFRMMIKNGLINNCPITIEDINIAQDIFGKNVHLLKGKTTRRTPDIVKTDYVEVPRDILKIHKNVTLCGDIFFVNSYPFFVTLSRNIKFNTVEALKQMDTGVLIQACERVFNIYTRRGFKIETMLMDMQFNPIRDAIMKRGVTLNPTSAKEHVADIERFIRVIKERARAMRSSMPYKKIPKRLIQAIIAHCCRWLNVFPPKNSISSISPRTLITGVKLDYSKHCRIEVGAYAQVHEETDPTNDTAKYRTTGAIALEANDNLQGGVRFLSLNTGRVIERRNFTILPIPNDVIKRVEELAANESSEFEVYDRNRNLILDDDDSLITGVDSEDDDSTYTTDTDNEEELPDLVETDSEYNNESDNDSEYDSDNELDDNVIEQSDNDEDDANIEELQQELENAEQQFDEYEDNNDELVIDDTIPEEEIVFEDYEGDDEDYEQETEDDLQNHDDTSINDNNNNMDAPTTRFGRCIKKTSYLDYEPTFSGQKYAGMSNLTRKKKKGRIRHAKKLMNMLNLGFTSTTTNELILANICEWVFEQYSFIKGLRKFGDLADEVAYKELEQMHKRGTFEPRHYKDLTKDERKKILDAITLIEEKRDGRVKSRVVANGKKQRPKEKETLDDEINKTIEDRTASPTAHQESITLTSIIDAKERRAVATGDIPNAFMQTDVNKSDTVIMKLRGRPAELLVKTAPELYRKYIEIENNKVVLYVEAWKAIYGTLKAALLFYRKFVKGLLSLGFKINPYDPCCANRVVNGKQMTIIWHVDDFKVSHAEEKELDKFIEWIKENYEDPDIGMVKVTRGKIHNFLGMTLDYSSDGEVKIDMVEYVKRMIECFPDQDIKTATTPAANHLFQVRDDVKVLEEDRAIKFHNLVAKGLFLCKRSRLDIQTAIAFLSTRVSQPDVDDWKKLGRLIGYLKGTKNLVLTLSADNTNLIKWYVDAAYAVHKDMKSHTGGVFTLGKGAAIASSIKQKLNTRSSTEAELVGVDDMVGNILWTNYFLKAQGYDYDETIIYQDNKSAILLEQNGMASSSKRTKHINIRYFFIKDRIEKNEVKVKYCPTNDMIADYFTKPLQGRKFLEFRKFIMNIN